jgi:formamidopyrimidine-DNA glycosylase
MPELPEVETIVRQLKQAIIGYKINNIDFRDKRVVKGVTPAELKNKIVNQSVNNILRRGKVLIFQLSNKRFLLMHLRISGWLFLGRQEPKHARIVFHFKNNQKLYFCDSRVLGEIRVTTDWQKVPIIRKMGPEPLGLKEQDFLELFGARSKKIAPLIMDQTFLAGVGNIYAQEALFYAKVAPQRPANTLSLAEKKTIFRCLQQVLSKAVTKGGSSVSNYAQTDGSQGSYADLLNVYRRKSQPCPRCQHRIRRIVVGGRGTYYCSNCQK